MFKIESYITPIILNYLEKYVKNIRPQDFQVSLWEGEVAFQNLDLRLDVLEQELEMPFEFLSGHIHELAIQVPWTKITSEPIRVLINTIEFVLKAKSNESGPRSSSSNSPQHSQVLESSSASRIRKEDETSPLGSGLAMKIINNINVQCQNIILKYVEEDIVVSMNVQYFSYSPANELWQPAMMDVNPLKVLMRKLINISDLTICLDKRNSAGQIDCCQEPILYRCTLEIRFLRKYNSNTLASCSTSRIAIFSQALDLNLSSLQVPMVMRLIRLLTSLSPNADSEAEGSSSSRDGSRSTGDNTTNSDDESYISWAWRLLPSFTFDQLDETDSCSDASPGHIKDIGVYIEELNLTLKNSEFINDAMMGGIRRIRYMPIVRFSFGGIYFEKVTVKEIDWSSTKAGLSSVYVEPLGQYRSDEQQDSLAFLETAPFTNMRSFIDKSLFDEQCMIADRGWGVTNYEDYVARITDDYLLYRSPIFAFDVINYRSSNAENIEGSQVPSSNNKCYDMHKQYRVLSAGITLRFNQSFVQVKTIIYSFIDFYDSTAYSSNVEKIEAYDATTAPKTKAITPQDQQSVPIESAAGRSGPANLEGSPKLHPPLVEDYDALMQGIPLCKYKIELKRLRIEMYAKTEPEANCRIQKRLPNTVQCSLPFLQLYFDNVQGSLSTPLTPDKLVHTTCQLPDKPVELLNACYDNYELNIKDFSIGLMSRKKDTFFRLVTIPKLQLSYGALLQPHHWKADEVSIKRLDIQCHHIKMEASKREFYASLYLYNAIWSFEPKTAINVIDILNCPMQSSDSLSLNCLLSKFTVKRRLYHTFDIWNATVSALTSDVIVERNSVQVERYNIFNSTHKPHNGQNKWLELQVQYPCIAAHTHEPVTSNQKATKNEYKNQLHMAAGIWMERFHLVADSNLLDFLSFNCEANSILAREYSADLEGQNPVVQNPPPTKSRFIGGSAPSTSLVYQTNPSLPQVFGRKSSRNSNSLRKISQPEETIHCSSEKDERIEYVTTEPLILDIETENEVEATKSDEEKVKGYYELFNSIIILMDVAQSHVDLSQKCLRRGDVVRSHSNEDEIFTRLCLPRILWKSTYADYITRSSLRLKINPPLTGMTKFNWTIQFMDFSIAVINNGLAYPVSNPCQTTLTVAMTKRKQLTAINPEKSEYEEQHFPPAKPRSPKAKQKLKHPSEHATKSAENTSVSSGSLEDIFSGSEQYMKSSSASPSSQKAGKKPKEHTGNQTSGAIDKFHELVCLNLHLDTSTIHLFGDNVKVIQTDIQHLLTVLKLARGVSKPIYEISATKATTPIQILTSSEENQQIKEFMDLDTNSDISTVPSSDNTSILNKISLFCQWTIAKVIAEISNVPEQTHRCKIVLELEDFLCTVDQGQDFTKYTNKIGNFNLNYHKHKHKSQSSESQAQEYLRIRMIAESNDLPFLNVVITKASLRDFYKRIGVKRKGEADRNISELDIVMQAMEVICDFNKVQEFVQPLCALMVSGDSNMNDECGEEIESIVKASDLPLMHFKSKGITCYFPLENDKQISTVLICKIESINITPNLQNPLQRKPLRPDVFGKAASMGILGIPGSMVEDRQYELTIINLSAASGNWNEILTHMHNKDHNFHTNPAVEWNNPERKQSLILNEIFKNFTLIATYAPNIVYNNILICGEAIEFNCSSNFDANLNTDQLHMLGKHVRKIQEISGIKQDDGNRESSLSITPSTYRTSQSDTTLYLSLASSSSLNVHTSISQSHVQKAGVAHPDIRRFSRLNSSSQFESIDEDIEPATKTDSGVQSISSKPSYRTRTSPETIYPPQSSSSILVEKIGLSYTPGTTTATATATATAKRHFPKTISFVAGIFCFKIFDERSVNKTPQEEHCGKALISCTISQPSFMTTQNIYDHVVNFSIFNFCVFLPSVRCVEISVDCFPLFCEPFIDTTPGEINSTGIPPALLTYRAQQTKLKMRELDIELTKPLLITISECYIEQLFTNLIIVYKSICSPNTNSLSAFTQDPLGRKSKISLMKANTLNADRLNVKCDNIVLKLTNHKNYECDLVISDVKVNLKYLTRPEKCSTKYSMGAVYLRTKKKITLHPIALKGSMEFFSEPWNRLPLVKVIAKFNVIQADISIDILQQLKYAAQDLKLITNYIQQEAQRFQLDNIYRDDVAINRQILRQLRCPSMGSFIQNNKSLKREEFYQDDLRAGAFQFVEISSDAVLPLPYQIQIIKKDYGIICWRYPQPRKMCKIHIYPVPMAVSNPIHIKCRMEYFSDVHELFLHYCDFWLSETNFKDIKLPEREICANIWRVVILQSLVSIDGECFDTSEEDEELHSIASINIEEVFGKTRSDSDFMLHPRVLVGCMRVDTTFQSNCVPKIQMLLTCNSMVLKLFNQQLEEAHLPGPLKRFNLAKATHISQAFLMFCIQNTEVYALFYNKLKYNANVSLTSHVNYLDYGFLNMLPLLEETSLKAYFEVDKQKNMVNVNIVCDRLRVNFGPSALHTLLSSKTHWEEFWDNDKHRAQHAVVPMWVLVNRCMTTMAFGQTGTSERLCLHPNECYLYSFRSDYHQQEITLYISDEATNTVDTSKSVHMPFKLESETMTQDVCVGSKCITLTFKKLSGSQVIVLMKGQIQLLSMVPHNLYVEFLSDGKVYDDHSKKPMQYYIDKKGRNSFFHGVSRDTNMSMRLQLADMKSRSRTGDIPLKPNKMLPWLVKVPVKSKKFISFWVRVLREDILCMTTSSFCPQKILITIWPIFEITSLLSCPIYIREKNDKEELQIAGEGEQHILDVSATPLTEHSMHFKFDVPVGAESKRTYTLCLKSLDWQKFFSYDDQKWTIDNVLDILSKPKLKKWPMDDEEETHIKRVSKSRHEIDVIYTEKPSLDFSCSLNLEIAPWGTFINATGDEICVRELTATKPKKEITIAANGNEMLFKLENGFTIGVQNNTNWIHSLPIFFENASGMQNKGNYVVTEKDATDVVILLSNAVYKFVLKLKIENERKILKLCPKFGIVNHSNNGLCLLPFAMDYKQVITRKNIQSLDAKVVKTLISPSTEWENSVGLALTRFHDINLVYDERSEQSDFVYFVAIKLCEDVEAICSLPIPLGQPFNRKCFSLQNGKDSIALTVSLFEHDSVHYLIIYEDSSPAVLVNNQTDCPFIIAQTKAPENSKVTSTTPEYEGKHFEWYQVIQSQSKCFYTPPEWYTHFPESETTLCNITLALYCDYATKKVIKWSKPIRTDKTWKKYLHIPDHGDVKVIICDKHRVIRINIYYISQQMEFSVKDLRLRLSSTEPTTSHRKPDESEDCKTSSSCSTITSLYTETPQFSKPDVCHHFRNECEARPDTKLRFFIKEFNLSLHIDNPQRQFIKCEVVSLVTDDFCMAYDDSEDERLLNVIIPNLQIDNQLFSTGKYDFPVILCAEELYQRTTILPDPFRLGDFYKQITSPMISVKLKLYEDEYKLCSVNCRFNSVRTYIEDAYITDFLDALVECEPSNCAYRAKVKLDEKQLEGSEMCIPQEVEAQALYTAEPLLLRSFCVEPISVLLSVHTSVRLYIALDHSPLSFSMYERKHLLTMPIKFGQSLGMHYLSGAIFGAGWVVGSLEILGSPSGLARSVTTGLKDFVSMPVRGLFRGPWGFVVGVTQGSASLLRNVTAGTVNSVTKLAASVARNLDRLSLDDEHIERTEALRRSRPQGFTEGFSQGITGLGISMLGAVGGLAHHTLEARTTAEVFTGLSKGLVGAFTKPISGAAELLALAGQGMLQTVGFNAMPRQRSPSACHNLALEPSGYRTWKLLPPELASDQILFYHEVTLMMTQLPTRGYVFLTSTVFAIIDGTCDKLQFAFPIDKVQIAADPADKTLYYVHLKQEKAGIEEDASYTKARIMHFLHTSSIKLPSESLYDLLQSDDPSLLAISNTELTSYKPQQTLKWRFYISEHLGEYLLRYFKIINSELYSR